MTSTAPAPIDTGWPPPPFLAPAAPLVGTDGVRRFHGLSYSRTPGYRPCLLDVHVPVCLLYTSPPTVPVELLHGAVLGAGLALVSVDYRHSLEAPFPAQLHDVKAAIRYVRRHAGDFGIDPGRIGAWGESAGGHLAALAGLVRADAHGPALEGREGVQDEDSSVRAVVDWYGVSEIEPLLGQSPLPSLPGEPPYPNPITALLGGAETGLRERARAASPVTYAGAATPPPFLLVHGREDRVVPFVQSESLEQALTRAGGAVTLRAVDGADHIFLGSAEVPAVVAESVDFLRRHLNA